MMLEDIARIGPLLVLAGLAAGWIAETVSRAGGRGLLWDMSVGLVGSVIVGVTLSCLVTGQVSMAMTFLIGGAGAAVAIGAQRRVWGSLRPGT